jgi:hypothetical protein
MAVKTFTAGEVLTAADTNTYLANSGLVFIKSQAVSGTPTTLTISNVFSSTYDNYKILFNGSSTGNGSIGLRLGASVTGYYGFLVYGDQGSNTVQGVYRNNITQFDYAGGSAGNGLPSTVNCELMNPFAASYTKMISGIYQDSSSYGTMQAEHRVSTSYTDATIVVGSGTFTTGTLIVYGYRKG